MGTGMLSQSRRHRAALAIMVVALVIGTAAGDLRLASTPDGDVRIETLGDTTAPRVDVVSHGVRGLDVTVELTGLTAAVRETKHGVFVELDWPGAPLAGRVGAPGVPVVRRLLIAPLDADVVLTVEEGKPEVVDGQSLGAEVVLMPVQPPIPKIPGARELADFHLDAAAYEIDAAWPQQRASVSDLGIFRGQRVMLLEMHPVAYNAATRQLSLFPRLTATVGFVGGTTTQGRLTALPGLKRVVLNPDLVSDVRACGSGNYLIITANSFAAGIAPFATAKAAQGFNVTTHSVADGTANTTIKSYIESLWGGPDAPEYILLVGDTNTIPHWTGGGVGNPATDLQYACMDGAGDWYPDIAIGRFPVRNATQLNTLIDKTLYTENGPLVDPAYLKRAVFMASVDNYLVSEGTHEYVINTYLEPNGYICDRLYQVTYGATTQDVSDSFNDGRFYGIYSGHGGTYSWADGPPFSQSDVNNLTNAGMYSFVCSFACITGTYTATECFMETWVLAPEKAAVVAIGSSVNSYWTEDDWLERVLFDAIFDAEDAVKCEAGPAWNEAKVRHLAHFGPTTTTRRYFEMYNIMGDPSLRLPAACSEAGTVALDATRYACESAATIQVADCGLNHDDNALDTVAVTVASDTEPGGEVLWLTETDTSSAEFDGTITLSATDSAGVLCVSTGDTVTVTYIDDDDGQGGVGVPVVATALVDCTPAVISNVHMVQVKAREVTLGYDSDEPTRGTIYYGTSCAALSDSVVGEGYDTSPTVTITDLAADETYYFVVEAEDEVGNVAIDDNGGACHSFTTLDAPDYFVELFASDDNDLAFLSLQFTPDDPADFYSGCCEEILAFPTDPAGDTPITLPDDYYVYIDLTGATVSLFGVAYPGFYVCSNGYITFTEGDKDYTESVDNHYDTPRISALFDDLRPDQGGTVGWQQLADRVAVTFTDVPEHGTANLASFQIEMFFDGQIRLSYLGGGVLDGLVGLSDGNGIPEEFGELNLSAMSTCGRLLGDLNCDGTVNNGDIDAFVLAITDQAGYAAVFPECDIVLADCNGDTAVNNGDIDAFVTLLSGE